MRPLDRRKKGTKNASVPSCSVRDAIFKVVINLEVCYLKENMTMVLLLSRLEKAPCLHSRL